MTPITAIVLAGGLGSRLAGLHPGVPKPMVPVAGRPFLEWVLRYWRRQGVHRFVISLGHLASVARQRLAARDNDGLDLVTVVEPEPMGTGGAVRYAAAHAGPVSPLLVLNADSLVAEQPSTLLAAWRPSMDGLLLGVEMDDASRYGSLDTGPQGRLLGFREKEPGAAVINGGVYLLARPLIERFPPGLPLSLERDVFPQSLREGAHLFVHAVRAPFLDIGTPESLALAGRFVQQHVDY